MRIQNLALIAALIGIVQLTSAQESRIYTHDNKTFQEALSLYNTKQYQAAQTLFEKVHAETEDEETKANSAYYVANAAVRLNQVGADRLMEDFVGDYPTSTKRNSAFLDVADYYFENGKYPYALKWYRRVDQTSMARGDVDRYTFNMGYALYSSRKPEEAERYLRRVTNSPVYGSQAKYYLGFIAYQQDDYDEASDRFDEITDPELLGEKLAYYQADLNFKLGKFEEAIKLAEDYLPRANRQEISELNKIIGESYFNLEQYNTAIPYLQKYKGKRGKWNNSDYYLLGYCYYKQSDYASAIQQFNKIIGGDNDVAQNAYYHLAECYLNLEKKQEALNAFRNASEMEFNEDIKKDALLNYARLSYDIGNAYEPIPQVLTTYLETYPGDSHENEIRELLVDSYITSRNFQGALDILENNKEYADELTFQKVAFYLGLEQFQELDYAKAYESFSKSLSNTADRLLETRSTYWKGESAYMLNRFEEASGLYSDFASSSNASLTDEYGDIQYNRGYAAFKLKEYSASADHFNAYVRSNSSGEKAHDAYARLGDSYFVTRQYNPAIRAYEQVQSANGKEKDYAAFQEAMCHGFTGNTSEKISTLDRFVSRFPNSSYRDDALFELGNTYVKNGQNNLGLRAYDQLIERFNRSSLVPVSLLRQGLVHYNASRNDQALDKFKNVVRKYPNSQEAVQAVSTAKLIYVEEGRVREYANWVKDLDFVEVTDAELDNASYESASRQLLDGNKDQAIKSLSNYLTDFPNGLHRTEAHFSLAQLYFEKNDAAAALPHYKSVVETGSGESFEQALTRVCEIYVSEDKYDQAMPYLLDLESMADIVQNRTFAQSNLMKGYYQQGNYEKTLSYAEVVENTPGIDNRIKSDARIMIARTAFALGDEERAKTAYARVKPIATGAIAAEALYYEAYFDHKDQLFERSNGVIQKLASDYAAYKEWGGKGLILMAKNYYELDDAFQATYILESVISNFEGFPDIVTEARNELEIIKAKEAQRNSSVPTDGN